MNPKQIKYLSLFAALTRDEDYKNSDTLSAHFKKLLDLDFALAAETWDYLCCVKEPQLNKDGVLCQNLGSVLSEMFYAKAQLKCAKTIFETPAVRRAAYLYNPTPIDGALKTVLVDALVGNKIADAEEILRCLIKNEHVEYGETMRIILEQVFIDILKKNPSKKIEMSRKLSTLLLTYIQKIKTPERAMLEQRVRETL